MVTRRAIVGLIFSAILVAPLRLRADEAAVVIDSPQNMQVFQRQTMEAGPVVLSGKVPAMAKNVRYRVSGTPRKGKLDGAWQTAKTAADHTFRVERELPAGGWYKLDVEALQGNKPVASANVAKFGVGEVFITAGQSNSTSCGQIQTKQTSGMVASFDGKDWALANDPMPGAHDLSGKSAPIFHGGSPWPAFGDAMAAKYQVPIGVAVTGHGGTSVLSWQPMNSKGKPGELFAWMMTRVKALGPHGFRAVLWHQGESDVKMPSDAYVANLTNVIKESKKQAGWDFPWFVAKVSYHNPAAPRFESTRAAHQKIWDTGVALPGPDTDTITGADRDLGGKGIHMAPSGLKKHGDLWAQSVGAYLDKPQNAK